VKNKNGIEKTKSAFKYIVLFGKRAIDKIRRRCTVGPSLRVCSECGPSSQCYNGGSMDATTCTCDCPANYFGLRCESM